MNYKTGFQFDEHTGAYVQDVEIRENPRVKGDFPKPKNVTFIPVPKPEKYKEHRFNQKYWESVDDYRGEWYAKDEPLRNPPKKILKVNVIPDLTKYIDQPPHTAWESQYWNDLTQEWVHNELEEKLSEMAHKLTRAQSWLDRLDTRKLRYLFESMEGDESGRERFDRLQVETKMLRKEYQELKIALDKEEPMESALIPCDECSGKESQELKKELDKEG